MSDAASGALWALTQLRELRVIGVHGRSALLPLDGCFTKLAALERLEVHTAKVGSLAPSAAGGPASGAPSSMRAQPSQAHCGAHACL